MALSVPPSAKSPTEMMSTHSMRSGTFSKSLPKKKTAKPMATVAGMA